MGINVWVGLFLILKRSKINNIITICTLVMFIQLQYILHFSREIVSKYHTNLIFSTETRPEPLLNLVKRPTCVRACHVSTLSVSQMPSNDPHDRKLTNMEQKYVNKGNYIAITRIVITLLLRYQGNVLNRKSLTTERKLPFGINL